MPKQSSLKQLNADTAAKDLTHLNTQQHRLATRNKKKQYGWAWIVLLIIYLDVLVISADTYYLYFLLILGGILFPFSYFRIRKL